MAFFSKEEVVLFSPMEGVITYEGAPAVGAEVVLSIKWRGDDGSEITVVTDGDGRFELPVIKDNLRSILPAEFVVYQDIHVHYRGDVFPVWVMSKREKALYGELGGRPVGLGCELTNELQKVDVPRGLLGTSCHWETIEK